MFGAIELLVDQILHDRARQQVRIARRLASLDRIAGIHYDYAVAAPITKRKYGPLVPGPNFHQDSDEGRL
jgi:hypothetical protein